MLHNVQCTFCLRHLCFPQAREWVGLWHNIMEHRATPEFMKKALQKMPITEHLVKQIGIEILKCTHCNTVTSIL